MKSAWWYIIVLLMLASVALRHNLLFLMSLLLALVGGVSWLWTRYCLAEVTYTRRFAATRLFLGDETILDIEIVNAKPLPLPWLRTEDEIPDNIEVVNARLYYSHRPRRRYLVNMLSLRWYERVVRHYKLRATHRGAMIFGPLEISAEDIFGFQQKQTVNEETDLLLVYPKVVPISVLGMPARRPFGDFGTPNRLLEDPLRLMGAREYVPGDSYRYIHWKATARRQTLQTRVFEASASRPVAIFLNINTATYAYEGRDPILQELAITTAASLAHYASENGYQVGLYVNSVVQPGGHRIRIRPGSHPDQLTWILEALAKVVEYGRWPIETILEVEMERLPYGATVVAITAVYNEDLERILLDLRNREHGIVLVTLGDARLEIPLPDVVHYHVGGREVWHELESLQLV